jgi:hypothetical protein
MVEYLEGRWREEVEKVSESLDEPVADTIEETSVERVTRILTVCKKC